MFKRLISLIFVVFLMACADPSGGTPGSLDSSPTATFVTKIDKPVSVATSTSAAAPAVIVTQTLQPSETPMAFPFLQPISRLPKDNAYLLYVDPQASVKSIVNIYGDLHILNNTDWVVTFNVRVYEAYLELFSHTAVSALDEGSIFSGGKHTIALYDEITDPEYLSEAIYTSEEISIPVFVGTGDFYLKDLDFQILSALLVASLDDSYDEYSYPWIGEYYFGVIQGLTFEQSCSGLELVNTTNGLRYPSCASIMTQALFAQNVELYSHLERKFMLEVWE